MNCTEAHRFLHAYIDNELDIAHTLDIERHLETCAACLENYNEYQALRNAMKGGSLYFTAPEKLQKNVSSALRQRKRAAFIARAASWRELGVVAAACLIAVALAVLLSGILRTTPTTPPGGGVAIHQQVFDSHMRSLMANHLVDIRSSNPDSIKPWFKGKLDYTPYVYDLTSDGYSLVGARLDYLNNRAVAAIVYQHQGHIINFFLWPTKQSTASIAMSTIRGYRLANWTDEKMDCWAISDADQSAIQKFASLQ